MRLQIIIVFTPIKPHNKIYIKNKYFKQNNKIINKSQKLLTNKKNN